MTNFIATDEQRDLKSSLRRLLSAKSGSARVRQFIATPGGDDHELWDALAGQLGVHGLAIPEAYGGLGLGYAELCVVLSELGRFLAVTPFLASVAVAGPALLNSGDTYAMRAYLPRLASGEWRATLAVADSGAGIDLESVTTRTSAVRSGDGWLVSGTKEIVLEAVAADLLLVTARTDRGFSLFAVEAGARGVHRTPLSVMDLTRRQARVELTQTPARLIGADGTAGTWLRPTLDLAAIAVAAEQVGGAERCLEMATEYARTRYQFGRPIGSYQAISHKCADILIGVEMARSALLYAASVADSHWSDDNGRELALAASIAKAYCSDAYMFAASENIQIHGGIGFTWEHDAHLFFKRAKSSQLMFGDPIAHRARIARLLALLGMAAERTRKGDERSMTDIDDIVAGKLAQLLGGADFCDPRAFWGRQYDLGLARVSFAPGCGGLGIDSSYQQRVDAALAAAGAPSNRAVNAVGLGYAAPTIAAHGTPEQKGRYLRPIFTTEEIWCQLFSEPGAGSDLAGLATRASRDGDDWIVNGQKVWTSLAHRSDLAMLMARTDPAVPKHKGLSYFVIDMHAPGVEVRPLRQMTGETEFNEVYLTDVRVPDTARIGPLGGGWRVAMTTLANERQTWTTPDLPRESGFIGVAVAAWRERQHTDPVRRDELVRLWVRAEVHRLNSIRAAQTAAQGAGPEGSIGKIVAAELGKEISSFTVDLLGGDGLLYSGYDVKPSSPEGAAFDLEEPQRAFLRARAFSIEAGSTEINKNVLAERVLRLPGDIRVDKDVPWIELRRS